MCRCTGVHKLCVFSPEKGALVCTREGGGEGAPSFLAPRRLFSLAPCKYSCAPAAFPRLTLALASLYGRTQLSVLQQTPRSKMLHSASLQQLRSCPTCLLTPPEARRPCPNRHLAAACLLFLAAPGSSQLQILSRSHVPKLRGQPASQRVQAREIQNVVVHS